MPMPMWTEPDCPRCRALDAQAGEVLAQLAASPALPPALKLLPPERLAILVKWTIVHLTNPRPQPRPRELPPPPPPTPAQRKHRRPLDMLVEDLGGEPYAGAGAGAGAGADAAEEEEELEHGHEGGAALR